jgi:hypothetical protein
MGITVVKKPKKTKEQQIREAFRKSDEREDKKERTKESDGHKKKTTEHVEPRKFKRKRAPRFDAEEGVDFKHKKIPFTKRERERFKDLRIRDIESRKVQT